MQSELQNQAGAQTSVAIESGGAASGPKPRHQSASHAEEQRYQPFPLTDIQQAYWVGRSGQFDLGEVSAHGYMEVEIDSVDSDRLEISFNRVVARHDMLRAIVEDSGMQRILQEVPTYRIRRLDLSDREPEKVERSLQAVRAEMSHQVLDAATWPLFDIRLTLLPGGMARLHLSIDVLIFDAHSFDIISRDWAEFYQQPNNDERPPLEFSFRDYVQELARLEQSEVAERSARYWRNKLDAFPGPPELPLASTPATDLRARFHRRTGRLAAPEWESLKRQAAETGLTPSALLLTAYARVLARWAAKPHLALSLTLFNRLPVHSQVDQLVGDFTAVLPLAVDGSNAPSFVDFARRLQDVLWEDMDHPHYSGVRVIRDLSERRRDGGAALPVVFTSTLQNTRGVAKKPAMRWLGRPVFTITQTPQVWLDCQVAEEDGELVFDWDAVEGVFLEGVLDDMFGAFGQLLQGLAAQESLTHARQLDLLPLTHRALIAHANATSGEVPPGLLHTPVLKQCERTPERVAVLDSFRSYSYSELRLDSNRLALCLWKIGVEAQERVGILLGKGYRQVVAALGILEAGAVYVPLDPEQPRARLVQMLETCGITRIVTTASIAERSVPKEIRCVHVDVIELEHHSLSPLPEMVEPTDLSYVIFTSGTTGRPKGVAIDHRGALNTVVDINERFGVGSSDRVLSLSALTFDLSVYDIFGVLSVGGAVVMPEPSGLRDPAHWHELATAHDVTLWNTVPALADIYCTYLQQVAQTSDPRLRTVLMSGDWIPIGLPRQLRIALPNAALHSLGGATEASIWSIAYPLAEVPPTAQRIPYGKPLKNQTFYVLNDALELCPLFTPGELYIGGIGLAHGYFGDPDQTARSFIKHPETGERLYRTGDLGRYLPDGNIEFLGRRDFQAKVNGYRVELEEIENAALSCSGVQAAVVALRGERTESKKLVGYFVPEPPPSSNAEKLALRLSEPGIRHFEADSIKIALPDSELPATPRSSTRTYRQELVTRGELAHLLAVLRRAEVDGRPKYRYGSAGSLYVVQTYLCLREGAVSGLPGGLFYYDPSQNSLCLVRKEAHFDESFTAPANASMWSSSAFQMFLVADLDLIAKFYGGASERLAVLEAGLMTQQLEDRAAQGSLGLCQVGGFDFERAREEFELPGSVSCVHCLTGGKPAPENSDSASAETARPSLAEEIQRCLRQKLPEYMVPTQWVELSSIPLSINGKVAREALPDPVLEQPPSTMEELGDQDELTQLIASAWATALGLESVSPRASFFDLGGTSVDMIKIHAQLKNRLPRPMSLVEMFFRHSSINELVAFFNQQEIAPEQDSAVSKRHERLARQRRNRRN